MSSTQIQSVPARWPSTLAILNKSAQIWFVIAMLGQMIFVAYIIGFYWLTAMQGDFSRWTEVLPQGLIDGDLSGNISLAAHVILAAIITFSGPLQLIPAVRRAAPKFHHWNGRVYLFTALIMSVSGLYMVWTRGTAGDWVQHYAVSLNGVLILIFALLALKHAIARNIFVHRRWALRLFMVVSGVWCYRVGLMFWLTVNQGPVGIDFETHTGPFLYFLSFASFLVPLASLELYFRAQDTSNNTLRWCVSILISMITLAMLIGIAVATMGMWFPKI